MSDPASETAVRLECLRIAEGDVKRAKEMAAFVLGDRVRLSGQPVRLDGGSFGARVRRRRRDLEMTQQELAERIGVNPTLISKTEKEVRNPLPKTVAKYAAALGCDPSELVNGL